MLSKSECHLINPGVSNIVIMYIEIIKFLDSCVPVIGPLLGALIGVRYGLEQIKLQRKIDFTERQLKEFYSPMLACREEIRIKSELRVKISDAAGKAWQEVCDRNPKPFLNHDKEYQPYKKIIKYDNQQLNEVLLPLYKKMLSIFSEKYWLADTETCKWYAELCRFVELWDRWLVDGIPTDVITKLDHSEEKLKPFYQELENQVSNLRAKIAKGGEQ